SDAKKMGFPPEALADLMLFYVENGVEYTYEFGDIDEPFYTSMENMYRDALELIRAERLADKFEDRAYHIPEKAEGTGWGFHETLYDFYYEYFY
ncbi:MAG: DUF6155 family protein, partial [Bacteroidota bacterium]